MLKNLQVASFNLQYLCHCLLGRAYELRLTSEVVSSLY